MKAGSGLAKSGSWVAMGERRKKSRDEEGKKEKERRKKGEKNEKVRVKSRIYSASTFFEKKSILILES